MSVIASGLAAQAEPGPVFEAEFSNPQLVPAQWTLEFHRDGSGHFQSHRGDAVSPEKPAIEAPDVDRDVQLSPQFAAHAFQVAERKRHFRDGCESHLKVAFQGVKKLTYSGPDGQGSCEFNYSKDQDIQSLGDSLVAVANTLIEGARLRSLLQHDPLGLDREIDVLQDSAGDGRAVQIGCIHDILQTLADDPAVMERVRRKARMLLAKANH
jgi:hypothetical protein